MSIQAVIFDWAGTMVDFGSCAPVYAIRDVLTQQGLSPTLPMIRAFMGMAKREHIEHILRLPEMADAWRQTHGRDWTSNDVDSIMEQLEPAMRAAAASHTDLIPGARETLQWLERHHINVGSTTGYTRPMMDDILPSATAQGYAPDVVICAGDTAVGRPAPLMLWKAMSEMGVWPAEAVVKVDDAPVGIQAGRHAHVWTVGVAASGNALGVSLSEWNNLSRPEQLSHLAPALKDLSEAGADYIIESVADLPPVIEDIRIRMTQGEKPGEKAAETGTPHPVRHGG